jgi:type IV pilus assembly protein PilM
MRLPTSLSHLNVKLGRGGSRGGQVVGLDIQPGFAAAVQARVNGSIVAERAELRALGADTMRDGEVLDPAALAEVLRDMFAKGGLAKRVRVGVANQRTVLRTIELPPVTDQKELAAAVNFQAQEQVPMPLNNAVLDFHPLGIVDTPAGPRQRVVLVAAQRDMVERLLSAVRGAGLTPEGVDLSAFALIRSLYEPDPEQSGRVLYLNVDGLSNLAIADGKDCRFTRVVGGGLEAMAVELAERRGIALADARSLLWAVDLTAPAPAEPSAPESRQIADQVAPADAEADTEAAGTAAGDPAGEPAHELAEPAVDAPVAGEDDRDYEPLHDLEGQAGDDIDAQPAPDADVWMVLENGIRDISGEVRNSLDFHRSQDGGGEVSHIVLSGAAEAIPGFAEALERAVGVEVRPAAVGLSESQPEDGITRHRLAIAAGLATADGPR